jgi:ATP-dependent exoDNAse (exonuclease V) alpha subunit
MLTGARKLPTHHLTIRVPWHDSGWDGTVCKRPADNTSCLVLPRIGTSKRDDLEMGCAGKRLDQLKDDEPPPCVGERVSFMSSFGMSRRMRHPYVEWSSQHEHFDETPFFHLPYSAACVPFRWMLKQIAEGDAERNSKGLKDTLQLGYVLEREPVLRARNGREVKTAWVQERDNQLVLLDTFFGAVEPQVSLCFFYAKRTPLSEDSRRVIVGVGRVLSVGEHTEYRYKTKMPATRSVLWERNVVHSIRPDFMDGFLFPYQEILALAQDDGSILPEDYVAFAPSDFFEQYSYGSELLPHDGAIASLLACAASLRKIKEVIPGSWDTALQWIDRELNRLWKARGAFPGLGSALCAFGLEHGNLIAYEIANAQAQAKKEWTENPWNLVDTVIDDPSVLEGGVAASIGKTYREKWKKLPKQRRALLELFSRCALSADQVTRFWVKEEREAAGLTVADAELLENPYRIYELDRGQLDAVTFATVDRGLFPDPVIQKAFPVPPPSRMEDAIDPRRVRAAVIHTLEEATGQGHTLLPQSWVVQRVRESELSPPCPLDEDTLAVTEDTFAPLVVSELLKDGKKAFQLERLAGTRSIIRQAIKRRFKAARHTRAYDWAALVAAAIKEDLPIDKNARAVEQRARKEKAKALEAIYASRISVLIGPAGTGKTTLLQALCSIDDVDAGGILLLAPTGKARVRLEQKTDMRGLGKTIAQFLNGLQRYDGETGAYYPNPGAPKCGEYTTVIIDECSMLTEEQLAAVLDAITNVERLVLVGDPRQLPPIGAGRPFVDIVNELAPADLESMWPKVGPAYAELTVVRRHGGAGEDDLLLVSHFAGRPVDPGADEVWARLERGQTPHVRLVPWKDASELEAKLVEELARALNLAGPDDEVTFETSIGGSIYEGDGKPYFWAAKSGRDDGAASKAEAWQILSPVRGSLHGVDALNRAIQARFRKRAREMATPEVFWHRRIPGPLGPQGILWGDKVINLQNSGRRRVWPEQENPYVANGDIGIAVGEYKTKKMHYLPSNLEVELATQPSFKYKYWESEFGGDEPNPPLELAYALTVHKTQGSEFGITFVVLPNPCWLLSRELLYTALTRHKNELVVLHQGPMREFRRFGGDGYSEIARRMTNLFREASPREVTVGKEKRFFEENLIHRTERGELVRSKSEVIIADKLHSRKIDYTYEMPILLDGPSGKVERAPDFTITDHEAGVTFYWEHLGMLDDTAYAARWQRKLDEYRRSGILPHEEGGGPQGTLIVTRDEPGGGLDSKNIAKVVDEVICGC